MGQYITLEDVRVRLIGKVRFTVDPKNENEMSEDLANRLINEAEGQVELDLSPRYHTPFRTTDDQPFSKLPNRPTREILRTLCEIQSVMKILDIDFGRGTVINAEKYYENIEKRYNKIKDDLLKRREEYGSGWYLPPLTGLKLAAHNALADDGFVGQVIVAGNQTDDSGSYPSRRINDPSQTFWRGAWDDHDS